MTNLSAFAAPRRLPIIVPISRCVFHCVSAPGQPAPRRDWEQDFIFDADAALKAAASAIAGLTAEWNHPIQDADRKEIIAIAVSKAWAHRDSFNPRKASFRTWIGRIARNCLVDYFKKADRRVEGVDDFDSRTGTTKAPDILMMEDEGMNAVAHAIEALPEGYREIIALLSDGKRPREIAKILNCSANAVSIRCFRARKALREKLSNLL